VINFVINKMINSKKVNISPALDVTFKNLFGIEKNKYLLIDFLNNILKLTEEKEIINIVYLDKEKVGTNIIKTIQEKESGRKILLGIKYGEGTDTTSYDNGTTNNDNVNNIEHFIYTILEELYQYSSEILNNKFEVINNKVENLIEINSVNGDIKEIIMKIINNHRENLNTIKNKKIIEFKNFMFNLLKPEDPHLISIKAKTKGEEILNIEILVNEEPKMIKRSVFYSLETIYSSSPNGNFSCSIPKVIMINILNSNLFNSTEKGKTIPHSNYTFKEKDTNDEKGFEDLFNIHIIELLKYKEYGKKHTNELRRDNPWILFLNNPNDDFFKQETTPKVFIDAREELIYLQNNPEFQDLYDTRERQIRNEKSRMSSKRERQIGDNKSRTKGKKKCT